MSKELKFYHIVILLCLSVFVFSSSTAQGGDGLLRVHFLDVGQGDAIFIVSPTGNQVLIDGGPDNSVVQELGKIMPFYDRSIDVVVASHPHSDHIGGLVEVLSRYEVANVVEAEESYRSPQFAAWGKAIAGERTNKIEATAGKVIDLGGGARLTILHPFDSAVGLTTDEPHDYVVVALLEYKGVKVVLTGDMEAAVERKLTECCAAILGADVLKVGHHGSKTSTTEDFVRAVSPQAAIIQVGAKNHFGHPTSEVLERLENFDIPYYRNDINGTITLVSDGEAFSFTKEK